VKRNLRLLEAIIKASPVAIIAVDGEDRIVLWSDSAERMFGWRKEEVEGRSQPILPPGEDIAASREQLQAGTSPEGIETVRLRRDGSRIPVRLWTAPSSEGKGYVSVLADLSDSQQAERDYASLAGREQQARELAVSAHRISMLFDAAPDAILEIDDAGRILLANTEAEHMFQRSREELLGLTVEALIPERFRTPHLKLR